MARNGNDPGPAGLGALIRQQRELAHLPLRQLAAMVGISSPYLSQIENGLRAPSDYVIASLASSLEISAESLREAIGRGDGAEDAVRKAIAADPNLTASQRRALLETYEAFTAVTMARRRART